MSQIGVAKLSMKFKVKYHAMGNVYKFELRVIFSFTQIIKSMSQTLDALKRGYFQLHIPFKSRLLQRQADRARWSYRRRLRRPRRQPPRRHSRRDRPRRGGLRAARIRDRPSAARVVDTDRGVPEARPVGEVRRRQGGVPARER